MDKFKGVMPALITPMHRDGSLNEDALRQVLEFNLNAGVHGFWIAGGTGESVLSGDEENKRIAEIAVDVCRGRATTIHHVGAVTTSRAAALAEHAAKVGVDAICSVPPFFYTPSPEQVVEHYRVVAAAADLPFFSYNLPGSTGVEITPDLMKNIQDSVPQLTGLKHSAFNLSNIRIFSQMGLAAFTGSSEWMLPAMTIGAAGCIDGPPGLLPESWVAIWNAFEAGDLGAARIAQSQATAVTNALIGLFQGSRYLAVCKFVLSQRLGIGCGDPRLPGMPLSENQRAEVMKVLEDLELDAVVKHT